MRTNLPVTNQEYDYPDGEFIVSRTDAKGVSLWLICDSR
jgi:hypothetical protein